MQVNIFFNMDNLLFLYSFFSHALKILSYIWYFSPLNSINILFCNDFKDDPIALLVTPNLLAISILLSGFSTRATIILWSCLFSLYHSFVKLTAKYCRIFLNSYVIFSSFNSSFGGNSLAKLLM